MKKVSISGHHISVTPAMETKILEKLNVIEKHFDHINSIQVVVTLDNKHSDISHRGHHNHKTELIVRVPGAEMFSHAEADDMYKAIATAASKLNKQITRHKERTRSHHVDKSSLNLAV